MTLSPLLSAPLAIQLHAFAALAILPLTVALFTLKRGDRRHRLMGWTWVGLMATIALSSFRIHELRLWGGFSPIHGLSVLTLASLVFAVASARHHRVSAHRKTMQSLTYGALIGAGLFTLLPGRVMHMVLFGG